MSAASLAAIKERIEEHIIYRDSAKKSLDLAEKSVATITERLASHETEIKEMTADYVTLGGSLDALKVTDGAA